jgi:hypothetical protein
VEERILGRTGRPVSVVGLGTDTLDLVQLHCPPAPVFSSDAVYDALDTCPVATAGHTAPSRPGGARVPVADTPDAGTPDGDTPDRYADIMARILTGLLASG